MKYDLSVIIPARNEMFLAKTVDDLLANIEGNTEIIVGLDGKWADPPLVDHPRLTLVFYPESIGQRALSNQLARLSDAKYIMKVDAHCAFDKGFDVKMMDAFRELGDNVTMVPVMRNLHAFNWVCPDGHTRYQGPSGVCTEVVDKEKGTTCGKETTRDVCWIAKKSPQSKSYCFDKDPHFQYFGEYCKRPEYKKDLEQNGLTESMSLQGSCFMLTRDKYWELDMGDEKYGSWGSQGIQVACSTWLSGGRVIVNHNTWYAHMFRTSGGDFGFPYQQKQSKVEGAKKYAKNLLYENNFPHQILPSSWLVQKFWPVKGWSDEDLSKLVDACSSDSLSGDTVHDKHVVDVHNTGISQYPTKGIIYYTDNKLNLKIATAVQKQLRKISTEKGIPIVSASLKPMGNMGTNIHVKMDWGRLAMFTQILAALEASTADIVYFCEHDVLYHPTHFDFTPPEKGIFYYDQNWWKVRTDDDYAIHYDANQLSGLCCYRETAIPEYRERVRRITEEGWRSSMGYEPGTRGIYRGGFSDSPWASWKAPLPSIDIKHGRNLTTQRWHKEEFHNQQNCAGWAETTSDKIEGWPGLTDVIGISKK